MPLPGLHAVDASSPNARLAARLQTIERRLDSEARKSSIPFVKATGPVTDADFADPVDGLIAVEANNGGTAYIVTRVGGSWLRTAVA